MEFVDDYHNRVAEEPTQENLISPPFEEPVIEDDRSEESAEVYNALLRRWLDFEAMSAVIADAMLPSKLQTLLLSRVLRYLSEAELSLEAKGEHVQYRKPFLKLLLEGRVLKPGAVEFFREEIEAVLAEDDQAEE